MIWSSWRKYLKLVFYSLLCLCHLLRPLFPFVIVPFKALKAVPWIKPNSCIFSQTYLYPSPFFWFKCVELTVTLRRFNPASRTNFMHSFGPFMPLVVSFRYFIAWWTERLQKQWLVHLFPPLKVKCVILQEKVMTVFLKISRQPLIRCDLSICLSIYHSFHTDIQQLLFELDILRVTPVCKTVVNPEYCEFEINWTLAQL